MQKKSIKKQTNKKQEDQLLRDKFKANITFWNHS